MLLTQEEPDEYKAIQRHLQQLVSPIGVKVVDPEEWLGKDCRTGIHVYQSPAGGACTYCKEVYIQRTFVGQATNNLIEYWAKQIQERIAYYDERSNTP